MSVSRSHASDLTEKATLEIETPCGTIRLVGQWWTTEDRLGFSDGSYRQCEQAWAMLCGEPDGLGLASRVYETVTLLARRKAIVRKVMRLIDGAAAELRVFDTEYPMTKRLHLALYNERRRMERAERWVK